MNFEELGYHLDCRIERIKRRLLWWRHRSIPISPDQTPYQILQVVMQEHAKELAENVSTSNALLRGISE